MGWGRNVAVRGCCEASVGLCGGGYDRGERLPALDRYTGTVYGTPCLLTATRRRALVAMSLRSSVHGEGYGNNRRGTH